MWFQSSLSWKLVGLDHASFLEEPTAFQRAISRYAAPEISKAIERGETHMQLQPAADMWSFGIIAFEILTSTHPLTLLTHPVAVLSSGSCVYDSSRVRHVIRKRLKKMPYARSPVVRRLQGYVSRSTPDAIDEEEGLSFVYSLLRTDPASRQTVTEALEDGIFKSVMEACQGIDSRNSVGPSSSTPSPTPIRNACVMSPCL